jgi:hypothetical protein
MDRGVAMARVLNDMFAMNNPRLYRPRTSHDLSAEFNTSNKIRARRSRSTTSNLLYTLFPTVIKSNISDEYSFDRHSSCTAGYLRLPVFSI